MSPAIEGDGEGGRGGEWREKHRVGVVEPNLVLRSLFCRGILGSCENGSVEGCILTFGERVLGDSFIFREGN